MYAFARISDRVVVIGGDFVGALPIGGQTYTCMAQSQCGFLAEVDLDGNVVWSKAFLSTRRGSSLDTMAIAVDASGGLAVTGVFRGYLDFGSGSVGNLDETAIYITRLDPSGATTSVLHYLVGQQADVNVGGAALDAQGDLYIAGDVSQSVDFGVGLVDGGFVARFSAAGPAVWAVGLQGVMVPGPRAVALDPQGDVVFGGSGLGPSVPCMMGGGGPAFVAAYSPSGSCVWTEGVDYLYVEGLVAHPSGGFVTTGWVRGQSDVGNGTISSNASTTGFVARLDATGHPQWGQAFGDAQGSTALGLDVDPATGDVAVGGSVTGVLDLGSGPVSGGSMFVATYDEAGVNQAAARYGDSIGGQANGLAYAASGDLFIGGRIYGILTFGSVVIQAAGGEDAFVAAVPALTP